MKRILLCFSLIGLVLFPPTSFAAECPSDWNYSLPILEFKKTTLQTGPLVETRYSSSFGRAISNNNPNIVRPELFTQQVQSKINALGANIAITSKYTASTKSFAQTDSLRYGDWVHFGYPEMTDTTLLWLGISNGTQITYTITISQKGCADLSLTSNTYTFSDIPTQEYGFDKFFQDFPEGGADRLLNFKELEIVKNGILDNIKITQSGRTGSVVHLNKLWSTTGISSSYLIVGISPGGCAAGRGTSIPTADPVDVQILQKPCKAGIIMYFKYAGGRGYGFTLVSTFELNPDPTPTPTPSQLAAEKAAAGAKAVAAKKKTFITCIKGKLTKKVTAVKPKCPAGYKKK